MITTGPRTERIAFAASPTTFKIPPRVLPTADNPSAPAREIQSCSVKALKCLVIAVRLVKSRLSNTLLKPQNVAT